MEDKNKVVLHGAWLSPYVRMVKIALKIKGVPYEYVEENLKKKSKLLVEYNPVYKQVPTLLHKGTPIVESFLILQYIDETWKGSPILLPSDPQERYMVRFWADFLLNQLYMSLRKVIIANIKGILPKRSIKELHKNWSILEQNMNVIFSSVAPSSSEDMGILDILLSIFSDIVLAIEDAYNLKLLEPKLYPNACSRMDSLNKLNVVKETSPPHQELVKFYQALDKLITSRL